MIKITASYKIVETTLRLKGVYWLFLTAKTENVINSKNDKGLYYFTFSLCEK
jgi:hypothetical protein